ncbi:MAG TPA: 50S ribosomal protein L6, partial [Saprospiraceae bacterium]|nr:50S ribosomal protein L6 [Saprospiraceae bacterium]
MSRVGKMPVSLPSGVEITVSKSNLVTVKGPKGTLSQQVHPDLILEMDNGVLEVKRPTDQKRHREVHGLTRALINNMVVGVSEGFVKELELVGVGYRASNETMKQLLEL